VFLSDVKTGKMKIKFILYTLLVLFGLSCCHEPETFGPEIPRVDPRPKTLIFYGNIGQAYFNANVQAAGRAIAAGALAQGHRILVCDEILGSGSAIARNVIYELVRDKEVEEGFVRDTLAVHEGADVRRTLDPADMRFLLSEMRAMTPEAVSFGLVLGAHGRGWVPKEYSGPMLRKSPSTPTVSAPAADPFAVLWDHSENPKTRYMGHTVTKGGVVIQDYRVDIAEFAAAMEGMHWNFMLFDVCLMGNIESLYEMRDIADYFIVSPAEVLIEGFPYTKIVTTLFADGVDWNNSSVYADVAHDYVNYYRNSGQPYATISVVDAAQLTGLAEAVRNIRIGGYNAITDEELDFIQPYESMSVHTFYDLDEYMRHWAQILPSYNDFLNQLRRTVVYKESTDNFYSDLGYSGSEPISHYSGLSAFIDAPATGSLTPYYKQTAWYKAVWLD
jgi:hypothetical protein